MATSKILVTDFDGTLTRQDFYQLTVERLLPPGVPDYWTQYRAGTLTHFDALRLYFAEIRKTEAEILEVVDQMELDPHLAESVDALRRAGWDVVVTSAGCAWYIDRLLAEAGVRLTVHANPGRFEPGRGLLMERPVNSPYWSHKLGIDKTAVVRDCLASGATVAFAGDGFPDADPARLVPADLRFARDDLAAVLNSEGLAFRPFDRWSEIARNLLDWKSEI